MFHVRCQVCDQYFLTEAKLERHQKKTHFAFEYRCLHYQCVESFKTAELLEQHKQDVHATTQCPQCGKSIQVTGLSRHMKLIHETDQRIVCYMCGKVSTNKHMFNVHVRTEHETHERLQCDICKEW